MLAESLRAADKSHDNVLAQTVPTTLFTKENVVILNGPYSESTAVRVQRLAPNCLGLTLGIPLHRVCVSRQILRCMQEVRVSKSGHQDARVAVNLEGKYLLVTGYRRSMSGLVSVKAILSLSTAFMLSSPAKVQ